MNRLTAPQHEATLVALVLWAAKMTRLLNIQSLHELREQMIAVVEGHRPAPEDAGSISFESATAATQLLRLDRQHLLEGINTEQALSLAHLAVQTGVFSVGQAATFAGLCREEFLEKLGAAGIPAVTYPASELEGELKALNSLERPQSPVGEI